MQPRCPDPGSVRQQRHWQDIACPGQASLQLLPTRAHILILLELGWQGSESVPGLNRDTAPWWESCFMIQSSPRSHFLRASVGDKDFSTWLWWGKNTEITEVRLPEPYEHCTESLLQFPMNSGLRKHQEEESHTEEPWPSQEPEEPHKPWRVLSQEGHFLACPWACSARWDTEPDLHLNSKVLLREQPQQIQGHKHFCGFRNSDYSPKLRKLAARRKGPALP